MIDYICYSCAVYARQSHTRILVIMSCTFPDAMDKNTGFSCTVRKTVFFGHETEMLSSFIFVSTVLSFLIPCCEVGVGKDSAFLHLCAMHV